MRVGLCRGLAGAVVLAALTLAFGMISDISFAGKSKITPHKLVILFTGDDLGNVKGCG